MNDGERHGCGKSILTEVLQMGTEQSFAVVVLQRCCGASYPSDVRCSAVQCVQTNLEARHPRSENTG